MNCNWRSKKLGCRKCCKGLTESLAEHKKEKITEKTTNSIVNYDGSYPKRVLKCQWYF